MLTELRVENLLLIERVELRFGPGLNVITGETGAGKTMLAQSIGLLLGSKPDPRAVRKGAEELWVEAEFELPDGFWDDPGLAEQAERFADVAAGTLVLARRVPAEGNSRAFVCHRGATASDLTALGTRALGFFGQFEHRKLALASAQTGIVDRFGGPEHLALADRYSESHRAVQAAERELAKVAELDGARARDADLLRFELDEIEAVNPDSAERLELASKRDRARNAAELTDLIGRTRERLAGEDSGAAIELLRAAGSDLERAAGLDPKLVERAQRIGALTEELGDLAAGLGEYLEPLGTESESIDEIEERLAAIERLERKHGGSVESVLAHAAECRGRLAELEGAGERLERVETELAEAVAAREQAATKLTRSRGKAASAFTKAVESELDGLALSGASLECELRPHPAGFGPAGPETVELIFSAGKGIAPAPLRDSASGGELSRVMLAIAVLDSRGDGQTLVFDEIDSGVGGRVAGAVGERLADAARERQLICITHLPQIASRAGRHFVVEKVEAEDGPRARVAPIDGDGVVAEVVRMLGAPDGDRAATEHAREMLAA